MNAFGDLLDRRWGETQAALGLPPRAVTLTWDIGPYPHFKSKRGHGVTFHRGGPSCHLRFAKKLLTSPTHRADGLIRHELGHVVDFVCDKDRLNEWAVTKGIRLPPTAERRADAIALAIWGEPVRYDKDLVQSSTTGVHPRPRHLGL